MVHCNLYMTTRQPQSEDVQLLDIVLFSSLVLFHVSDEFHLISRREQEKDTLLGQSHEEKLYLVYSFCSNFAMVLSWMLLVPS